MSPNENVVDDVARAEPIDPLLGKVLNGKFKILSQLATGGMGTIYRGEQMPLGRPVAIKVLIPNQASRQLDPNFHKRFFLEASILARLQHPNIVTVFDYGKIEQDADQDRFFMAMEFLEGETLFRRVRRQGRLPPPEAMRIARQIARGLREAHKHGVVHRDLKPSNVMLVANEDNEEAVKILDFGLVKQLGDDSEELTQQGAFLGSPRFMSPEQISHGKVDLRTDIYSLGVILYQMLCGKVPFESEKSIQILMAHLQQPVPRMKDRNPDVDIPEPLEGLVMRCLAKDPDGRPATMDALIQGIGECARGMGVTTAFGNTQITSLESLPGVQITPRNSSTMAALKEAVTLPAPSAEEEVNARSSVGTAPGLASGAAKDSTESTKISALATPQDQRGGSKRTLLLVGVGAVVVAGAIFAMTRRPATIEAPVVATTGAVPSAAAPSEKSTSFSLIIESTPPGASVMEDGKSLGTTPLRLSIENDAVRAQPRRLSVQKDGFQPYSIVQGPSDETVRFSVPLAESAPTTAGTSEGSSSSHSSKWRGGRKTPPPPPPPPSAKGTPKEQPPDIRNTR